MDEDEDILWTCVCRFCSSTTAKDKASEKKQKQTDDFRRMILVDVTAPNDEGRDRERKKKNDLIYDV